MLCKNCQKEIPESSTSCEFCEAIQESSVQTEENIILTEEKTNKCKCNKKWIIIGIAILLFLIAIIIGSKTINPNNPTTNLEITNTTILETTSPIEVSNRFKIGEIFELGNEKIKFVKIEKWNGYDEKNAPKEGNTVLRAYFEIENIGKKDLPYGPFKFVCYADGEEYEEYWCNSEEALSSGIISPDGSAIGYIYFEIPEDTKSVEIEYDTDFWENKNAIFMAKFE